MKKLASLMAVVLLAGCASQSYIVSEPVMKKAPKVNEAQTFFISGLGQTKEINAAQVCGDAANVAKIENQQTFLNGFLHLITWGIYSPRQVRVYCK